MREMSYARSAFVGKCVEEELAVDHIRPTDQDRAQDQGNMPVARKLSEELLVVYEGPAGQRLEVFYMDSALGRPLRLPPW